MKTAHRKQSKFKRDPRAMERAFGRVGPFTPPEITAILLPPRAAFEAMKTGRGVEDDFHTLASAANIALVRGESIDERCVAVCEAGMAALMRMKERHALSGRWGLDGRALGELVDVLDLYDQLVENSSPQQMRDAMTEVVRRMNAGSVLQNQGAST